MPKFNMSDYSDFISELQETVWKIEKSLREGPLDGEHLDAIAKQVRCLRVETDQVFPMIISNENYGVEEDITPIVIVAVAFGAIFCGLKWWKNGRVSSIKDKQVFFSNYGKMDEQKKISGEIKNKNGRVSSIKDKQFVEGKGGKMPDFFMDGPDRSGKRCFLGASEAKQLKGLQYIVEAFETENYGTSNIDEIIQNDSNSLDNLKPKRLSR